MENIFNKTLAFTCLSAFFLLNSCSKKDDETITGSARVSFTHAAIDPATLDAYVDNEKITTIPLVPGSTSGLPADPYFTVNAGLRALRISPDNVTNVLQGNFPFKSDGVYSIFAHDTINTSGTLRALVLTDNLTAPADTKTNIRFLQLSPDTGRLDIQLVNSVDTIPFIGRAYVGSSSITESLAVFTSVDPGNYTLNVRTTGSNTILYSTPISLAIGKIYSIYSRGRKANGTGSISSFSVNYFSHN